MARVALFFVCFAILVQSVQRTWIVVSWKMNQSYIASTLCEKRLEKKSCCAGSCYLNKQLKANEEKQESIPLNEKQRIEYVSDLFNSHFTFSSISIYIPAANFPKIWVYGQTKKFNGSIFHPPSYLG